MDKILYYIARETQGKCFASFKYCYDNTANPNIEYEPGEENYINMKEYAEDKHNPKTRDIGKSSVSCPLKPSDSAPLKHSTMPP